MMLKQEVRSVIMCCSHVPVLTPALAAILLPESPCSSLPLVSTFSLAVALVSFRDVGFFPIFLSVIYPTTKLVNVQRALLESFTRTGEQLTILTRRRRIPLLERRSPRVQGDNALVLEGLVWVREYRNILYPDEVKGIHPLIPLDHGVCMKLDTRSDNLGDELFLALDANRTMLSNIIPKAKLAFRSTFIC